MKYRTMAGTDLEVSRLCLGTVKYGAGMDEADAHRQMDRFCAAGGNFIDTAHVYGDWVPGERAASEHIIGRWLKKSGARDRVILSTKGGHPDFAAMSVTRVTPACVRQDLDESLAALQTDRIDLYFLHRDNEARPAAEILGVLEDARRAGKIRWYGCSNWSLPRIREAAAAAKENGFSGFVCNQVMWSLADINIAGVTDKTLDVMDRATYDYHCRTGMAAMAFTSLAHGYLSKRLAGRPVDGSDAVRYDNPRNDELLEIIRGSGVPVGELSLAYLMDQPFTAYPIATFRTDEQMAEGLRACERVLPPELTARIGAVKHHAE
jgi:aryl-alcohol dehydrogenase-like predicted oxidoreductase